MASFYPVRCTSTRSQFVAKTSRIANPSPPFVAAVLVREFAVEQKDLLASWHIVGTQPRVRRHSFDSHRLAVSLAKQLDPRHAGDYARMPNCSSRIDDEPPKVPPAHLSEFHENGAAWLGMWLVAATGRVADVCSHRIVAVLIREDTVEHEKLFAQFVRVCGKAAHLSVAHQRRSACDFATDAIEQPSFNSRLRRGQPGQCVGQDDDPGR